MESESFADFPVRLKGGYIQSQASGVGRVKGRGFPFARTVFLRLKFSRLLYSEVCILGSPKFMAVSFVLISRGESSGKEIWKQQSEIGMIRWFIRITLQGVGRRILSVGCTIYGLG